MSMRMTAAEVASGTRLPTVCANRLIRSGDERCKRPPQAEPFRDSGFYLVTVSSATDAFVITNRRYGKTPGFRARNGACLRAGTIRFLHVGSHKCRSIDVSAAPPH